MRGQLRKAGELASRVTQVEQEAHLDTEISPSAVVALAWVETELYDLSAARRHAQRAADSLSFADDPVARATAEFDRLFPEGEQALIMLEAPDPLSAATLVNADRLEHELAKIPQVEAHSLLDLYRRSGSSPEAPCWARRARRSATR